MDVTQQTRERNTENKQNQKDLSVGQGEANQVK